MLQSLLEAEASQLGALWVPKKAKRKKHLAREGTGVRTGGMLECWVHANARNQLGSQLDGNRGR